VEEHDLDLATSQSKRHARKRLSCDVLMMHGVESWTSRLEDISATGLLVERPPRWKGCPADLYVLDLMFEEELHIHLEATIARITRSHLGFTYARIPEDKEVPLWTLLGGYADSLEEFKA
jgi:hypothetical protein